MTALSQRLNRLERSASDRPLVFGVVPSHWSPEMSEAWALEATGFERGQADYLLIPQHLPEITEPSLRYVGAGNELFQSIAARGRRIGTEQHTANRAVSTHEAVNQ